MARLSGAAGVHVGQDDLSPLDVRRVAGAAALVGRSTHTVAQLARAAAEPVEYVAIGPVYRTETKETGYEPVGLELVRAAVRTVGDRPVVAIGGMTVARAVATLAAGATSVAVIGDLLRGDAPTARVRAYLAALEK